MRSLTRADIVLVVPPFAGVRAPAIGSSLLAARCRAMGLSVQVYYANIVFASILGLEAYERVCSAIPSQYLPGESVFRPHVEPPVQWGSLLHELERLFPADGTAAGEELLTGLLSTVSEAVPGFLEIASEEVLTLAPRIVGFSSMFQQTFASAAMALHLRRMGGAVPIMVLGGANARAPMGDALLRAFPWLDFVFSGEADQAFPGFARDLVLDGKFPAGRLVECSPPLDLELVETPDYEDYFSQIGRLQGPGGLPGDFKPVLYFESSRGCWWGHKHPCTFCGLNCEVSSYRQKTSARVLREIERLACSHEIDRVQAVDNIMPHSFFRVGELLTLLANRKGGPGVAYEVKANLRQKDIHLLARSGVDIIQPGIESLSTRLLGLMNKGTTSIQNIFLLRETLANGLAVVWNLLIGVPGETLADYGDLPWLVETISHLQAPIVVSTIKLDRYSPYFLEHERFGIHNLRCPPVYRLLFPASEAEDAAFFFDGDFESELLDDFDALDSVVSTVNWWISLWRSGTSDTIPRLSCLRLSSDCLLVHDTRRFASEPFGLAEGEVLRCIERTEFPVRVDSDHGLDPRALAHALQKRWIICLDGRYLSILPFPRETMVRTGSHHRAGASKDPARGNIGVEVVKKADGGKALVRAYANLQMKLQDCRSREDWEPLFLEWSTLKSMVAGESERRMAAFLRDTSDVDLARQHGAFQAVRMASAAVDRRVASRIVESPAREWILASWGGHLLSIFEEMGDEFPEAYWQLASAETERVSKLLALQSRDPVAFRGERLGLGQVKSKLRLADETQRRQAFEALLGWAETGAPEFEDHFGRLISIRREMAASLGEASYTSLAYRQARRFGWDSGDAAQLRVRIQEEIVPLVRRLWAVRCEHLGRRRLLPWDTGCHIVHCPEVSAIGVQDLRSLAGELFRALDGRVAGLFRSLGSAGRLDVEARPRKHGSAFCAFFPDSGEALVSINPAGDYTDVFALAHEMGHAFAFDLARTIEPFEYKLADRDVMEVHSVTMEHLTLAVAATRSDYGRALRNLRLVQTLEQLPFLALSDAFHHRLYEGPATGMSGLDAIWAELVDIFQPDIDFKDHERGRGFRWRLGDFFSQPFYAIEYAIAEIAALQFLVLFEQDPRDGFERYVTFCRMGGSRPLLEALGAVGLQSPFSPGAVRALAGYLEKRVLGERQR